MSQSDVEKAAQRALSNLLKAVENEIHYRVESPLNEEDALSGERLQKDLEQVREWVEKAWMIPRLVRALEEVDRIAEDFLKWDEEDAAGVTRGIVRVALQMEKEGKP